MRTTKCYKELEVVLNSATERFAPGLVEDKGKRSDIEALCGKIDSFMKEKNCSSYRVSVDDETTEIVITMDLFGLVYEKGDVFIEIIDKCKGVGFYRAESHRDFVTVELIIPGIWKSSH